MAGFQALVELKKKGCPEFDRLFWTIHNESIISAGSVDCFIEPGTYISSSVTGPLSGIARGKLSGYMQLQGFKATFSTYAAVLLKPYEHTV